MRYGRAGSVGSEGTRVLLFPQAPFLARYARPETITLGTPQFELAHSYGLVRFTLDIWEGYLGGPFPWHFSAEYDELEITIFRGFDNSRAGWGYLELGSETWPDGTDEPFALNLD